MLTTVDRKDRNGYQIAIQLSKSSDKAVTLANKRIHLYRLKKQNTIIW